jgi:hypothetical protein
MRCSHQIVMANFWLRSPRESLNLILKLLMLTEKLLPLPTTQILKCLDSFLWIWAGSGPAPGRAYTSHAVPCQTQTVATGLPSHHLISQSLPLGLRAIGW